MGVRCASCGTENPETSRFCSSCGADLAAAMPPAGAGAPPASTSTPPAQPDPQAGAAPIPPPSTPGVYAAPPPGMPGAPGQAGGKGKIVAIVVAVVALLAVFAAFKLLTGDKEEPATTTAQPAGDTGDVEPGGSQEAPAESGALADYVEEQVGPFTATDISQDPDLISNLGANDGYSILYSTETGGEVLHHMLAYSSQEESDQAGAAWAEAIIEKGLQATENFPLEIDGETVGTVIVLDGDVEGQAARIVLWNNGALLAAVIGTPDDAAEFFKNVPY